MTNLFSPAPPVIDDFNGKYRFLSNFSEDGFRAVHLPLGEKWWPTNEHYYQAMKTLSEWEAYDIWNVETPGEAKKMGRKVLLRKDWEEIKILVMRKGLELKFELGSELAKKLLATGDAMLIEGNNWGDSWWGVCRGKGRNWLGHLLMARRAELRAHEI
jgi:ribA/ribD-fused uncharacterized protein